MTIEEVRELLSAFEPDYDGLAAQVGDQAKDALTQLVDDKDAHLAAKAVYLAGLIPDGGSVLAQAAKSDQLAVRIAAAATIRMRGAGAKLLDSFLRDPHMGVRKEALISAGALHSPELKKPVQQVAESDASPYLRELAGQMLKSFA